MVQDQGVDVYLAPFDDIGKRYHEHAAPANSPVSTSDSNEVWIEAVDGERFVLVVDLLKNFDRKGSKMLRVDFNSHNDEYTGVISYSELGQIATNEACIKNRVSLNCGTRKVDGRWFECGFKFALLKIDEDMEMDQDQINKSITSHGKIVVEIQRGNLEEKPASSKPKLWDGRCEPDTDVSSKAVVKDNHVSHAVGHVILGDSTQPRTFASVGHWNGLRGKAGNTIKFTIHYRSRDVLQQLKIIPKDMLHIDLTDSPPPSPRVKREGGGSFTRYEDTKTGNGVQKVKQETTNSGSLGGTRPPQSNGVPANDYNDTRTSREQYDKKRKAMQDELAEVELEQKRLRLKKALAEMEGIGK